MNTRQKNILQSLAHPMQSDNILDPVRELTKVIESVGLHLNSGGGSVSFTGKDPIISSPLPLATMAGVSLMAKAIAVADIWRMRTGQSQNLSINLGQVLHRLCPFYDRKWELLNGCPPGTPEDLKKPFMPSCMYETLDNRRIQLVNPYPKSKAETLKLLGCHEDPSAIAEIVKKWNSFKLEEAANRHGIQATVIRTVEEFLTCEQFPYIDALPLIEIEKIGDSKPVSFTHSPKHPLDGIRALGLGHVIAGSGFGRALAYHGADVLNIWRPMDFEFDMIYYSANVGMRSKILEIGQTEGMEKFHTLLKGADIFFSNRRPGYLEKLHLSAESISSLKPGIIHVDMSLYGHQGPWANRIGFDQNAGGVSGILSLEGTAEDPRLTEIFVVNDYAMSWLGALGAMVALKRRAIEGGSYRIRLSLTRLSLWLLEMGIFDKNYVRQVAGIGKDHAYLVPETFCEETPCGLYQGVTDQVYMSKTPGMYQIPLVPRGSSKPEWL